MSDVALRRILMALTFVKILAVLLLVSLLLSGCGSGNATPAAPPQQQHLGNKVGYVDAQDATCTANRSYTATQYGQPDAVEPAAGGEIWFYEVEEYAVVFDWRQGCAVTEYDNAFSRPA